MDRRNGVRQCDPLNAGVLCHGDVLIADGIVWGNLPQQLHSEPGGKLSVVYSAIQGGWAGPGSISDAPLLAHPGSWVDVADLATSLDPSDPKAMWLEGNYHLRFEQGRWDTMLTDWVTDSVTSPFVDGGNPARDPAREPTPHGGLTNMGAFGGTGAASISQYGGKAK